MTPTSYIWNASILPQNSGKSQWFCHRYGLAYVQIVVHLRRLDQVAWKEKRWQPVILAPLSEIL